MKKIFFSVIWMLLFSSSLFSQQANTDTTIRKEQKLYFPVSSLDDSVRLSNSIPVLAQVLIKTYQEADREKYFGTIFRYYLLSGDYVKAIDAIDSVQKLSDSKVEAVNYKSYALARIDEKGNSGLFGELFSNRFASLFSKLSFNEQLHTVEGLDTSALKAVKEGYLKIKERLSKQKEDSISFKDAQELCRQYCGSIVFSKINPFTKKFTEDPKYQELKPAIKSGKYSGVVPVMNIDEKPDPKMKYRLLMELTSFGFKDDSTAQDEMNAGLVEAGRILNLHVVAGVPKENIDMVIVVHGSALYAFLNNEKYKIKYNRDNPNIPLIKEFTDNHVRFIACGQAIYFFGLEKEFFVPEVKVALTAQTVLSTYKSKNYIHYDLRLNP